MLFASKNELFILNYLITSKVFGIMLTVIVLFKCVKIFYDRVKTK
jgi:hypothetical protein